MDSGEGPVPALDPRIERMALRLMWTSSGSSSSSSPNRSNSRSPHRGTERRQEGYAEDTERVRDERRRGKQPKMWEGGDGKQYRLFVVGF